jgi:hypothetical protein
MLESSTSLQDLDQLRRYVAETLSRLETLKSDQFRLTQEVLYRGGKPCGVHFCLHGPRAMRLSAIWETDHNSILFYGSCGRRLHRTRLVEAPLLGQAG